MDIVTNVLKKQGYNFSAELCDYYNNVNLWTDWWKGYVEDVHQYSQAILSGAIRNFDRKTMGMAKKVSEDWANLLLTHKTLINVDDETTQKFLAGDAVEQTGGVLGKNNFWESANILVEKAYAKGTGAVVLRINDATLKGKKLTGGTIKLEYIDDATMIYPLSWNKTDITECAFGSINYIDGKKYLYLEKHLIEGEGYKVVNEFYLIENEVAQRVNNPKGILGEFTIGCKLFHVIKPNIANNIYENGPLGISIYANALDQLEACDVAYDNFVYDFLLGRKRVFMNQDIIQKDANGKPNVPKSMETRLFYSMGGRLPGEDQLFQEYNPLLRVEENKQGIQMALDVLSSKVGFGQHRYSFDAMNMTTATEVKTSNKDLTESVAKQRVMIENFVKQLVESILWIGKNILHEKVKEDAKIVITFDDSMFQDIESEKQQFLQEIRDGIRQKWEYRVKYFGEDEETARKMVADESGEGITYNEDEE